MAKELRNEVVINEEWCKGCSICISFCPKQVLELSPSDKAIIVRSKDCISCGLCEIRCPDLAVELHKNANKEPLEIA